MTKNESLTKIPEDIIFDEFLGGIKKCRECTHNYDKSDVVCDVCMNYSKWRRSETPQKP
jgi:hypothetical protein